MAIPSGSPSTVSRICRFSPLAGGYLTGKYRQGTDGGRRETIPFPPVDETRGAKLLDAMDPIAAAHGTSLEAVALAWLRTHPSVTSIITGVRSVAQLDANLSAVSIDLTADEIETLSCMAGPSPEYPGWMLAQGSAARRRMEVAINTTATVSRNGNLSRTVAGAIACRAVQTSPFPSFCFQLLFPEMACPRRENEKDCD